MATPQWENFDIWAEKMAALRTCTFAEFVAHTTSDFLRLARIATRRKRPPSWMTLEDVAISLTRFAWHYALERVAKDGHVGYDASKWRSGAGSYLRRKLRQKIAKEISKARGEHQGTRRGPPRVPEYLSRTGEHGGIGGVPDVVVESVAEQAAERALRFRHLERICETPKELTILRAIEAKGADEDSIVECLASDPFAAAYGVDSPVTARAAFRAFVSSWSKELGSPARATR